MKLQRPQSAGFGGNPSAPSRRGRRLAGRVVLLLALGLFFASFGLSGYGETANRSEYRLKLAFLYHFAQFVQWPNDAFANPQAPLTICVVGENPFSGDIEEGLRGRFVAGHPLELRQLGLHGDPRACQMVFVRANETKLIGEILAASRGASLLTVGEAAGFVQRGGIINLTRDENNLRFEVNIDQAAQTRLKISSKLLSLAKIIRN